MARRVEFRMGNADAPSPWGRDEIDIAEDGHVTYQNQRGKLIRTRTHQLSVADAAQLFAALAASPFPHSVNGPFLPGSVLIELGVTHAPNEACTTARLEYQSALKTPGYDILIGLLAGLAAKLRAS